MRQGGSAQAEAPDPETPGRRRRRRTEQDARPITRSASPLEQQATRYGRSWMARRKHSAALFEVIVPTKPLTEQRSPGMFRSIAGWLRAPRSGGGGRLPIERSIPVEPVY